MDRSPIVARPPITNTSYNLDVIGGLANPEVIGGLDCL